MPELASDMVQVHPFRLRDGIVEHLLLRRSDAEAYGPGVWQVITGGVDAGERAIDAALRELREETGLAPDDLFSLPSIAMFYFEPTDRVILSPVFACRVSAEPILSHEHSDYRWTDAASALEMLIYPTHHQGVRELEMMITRGGLGPR